jgi:hypothetical protein
MESGRMPACDIVPLVGDHIAGGNECLLQGENINNVLGTQVLKVGNRCGHDKNNLKRPNFNKKAKRRPHVLEEAKRRIDQAITNIYAFPEFTQIFYHPLKEEKGRRRRSESVEGSLCLALPTIIHSLDIHRMSCGFYDNQNKFHYYNFAYIENVTDQNYARVKREMKLLQDYGIIKVQTIREQNNDGSWRTTEVRIDLTDKIFQMLELMPEFLKDRETIAKRFHEKQSRLEKNRKKREIYRKPSITPVKAPNPNKINATLQPQLQNLTKRLSALTKRPQAVDKGRGIEIRDKLNLLVSKGYSVAEAVELLRKSQAPPN